MLGSHSSVHRVGLSAALQYVTCYNCGSAQSRFYDSENGFTLVKCLRCGLLYVNPRPADEEIDDATTTGLHRGAETFEATRQFRVLKIGRYLGILTDLYGDKFDYGSGAKWLDIGCGHGEFMAALQQYSRNRLAVRGSEPNLRKVQSARQRGLEVDCLDLDRHSEQYSHISLLNVYSHLPNPVETLRKWTRLLGPAGELLLETGHSCHLDRRDHHRPYYLPDHLSFANRDIVVSILERIGFEVISVRFFPAVVFPPIGLVPILKNLALLMLGRKANLNYPPRFSNRDMWIRARLVDSRT